MVYHSSRAARRRPPERGPYDRQMIRDFLNHLLWELRAVEFDYEQQRRGVALRHPELDEVLDRFFQKYGVGLLPLTMVDNRGATPEQVGAARRQLRVTVQAQRRVELLLLEALWPLFEEALECADPFWWAEDRFPLRVIAARVIPAGGDSDPE